MYYGIWMGDSPLSDQLYDVVHGVTDTVTSVPKMIMANQYCNN